MVAACAKCEGLLESLNLEHPYEYRAIVRQLIEKVASGALVLKYANCPLEEILGPVWPGDTLYHDFSCASCGKLFRLHADTYHGSASWEEITADETPPFRLLI
jgi:hypothetical protein